MTVVDQEIVNWSLDVCVCVRVCLLFGLDRTRYYCVGGPVFGMM